MSPTDRRLGVELRLKELMKKIGGAEELRAKAATLAGKHVREKGDNRITKQHVSSWYTDDNISQLMDAILRNRPDVQYMNGINIDLGRGSVFLQNLLTREQNIAVHEGKTGELINQVFVPINLGGMNNQSVMGEHWTGLIIVRPRNNRPAIVYYFDPFGNAMPAMLRQAIRLVYPGVTIRYNSLVYQQDSINCGAWVVEFFRQFVLYGAMFPQANTDIGKVRS